MNGYQKRFRPSQGPLNLMIVVVLSSSKHKSVSKSHLVAKIIVITTSAIKLHAPMPPFPANKQGLCRGARRFPSCKWQFI